MERLLAIGDIHGCRDALDQLLDRVQPKPDDRLVFLGDYVDRGPDTRGVLERLLALRDAFPATVFLRGNHEQLLLDALAEAGLLPGWVPLRTCSSTYAAAAAASDLQLWLYNGGAAALASYGNGLALDRQPFPAEHLAFLQGTVLWHLQEDILFVHAGAAPTPPVAAQDPYTLLWARHLPPLPTGAALQVVGHTPTGDGQPRRDGGRLCLDTGAVYGRALSCCDLRSGNLWQVPGHLGG